MRIRIVYKIFAGVLDGDVTDWYFFDALAHPAPFLFGIYGRRARRETVELLRSTRAAGVLLLARNIDTPEQTRALTSELVQRVGRPLIFTIDHEGGWVLRFKSGMTPLPGNCALGRAADPELAYATGRQMALELSPLGIQVNLAPVLDVLTGRYNPGIGIRSFGGDARLAGILGAAFIRGLQDHGVAACAKHFPGKGAASVDAHVELPTIRMPAAKFRREHLSPFADAVKAGVDSVMTSHVRFPALDSAVATFSSRITRRLLREELGFDGVVMADDLCMGAVAASQPVQMAAVHALNAGHDLLIIAHDERAMRESAQLLELSVGEGLVDAAELARSARRVERLLRRARKKPGPADPLAGAALSSRVSRAGLRWTRRGSLETPLAPSSKPLLVVFPDFADVAQRFTFEGGPLGPERFVRRRLAAWGPHELLRAPVSGEKLGGLERALRSADRVLFFCFEAMRFPGQRAALRLVARRAPQKSVTCLIRNPWDAGLLPARAGVLDAGGYRLPQLSAALNEVLS